MNGYGPYVYPKEVLTRLATQRAKETEDLLPYQWSPV